MSTSAILQSAPVGGTSRSIDQLGARSIVPTPQGIQDDERSRPRPSAPTGSDIGGRGGGVSGVAKESGGAAKRGGALSEEERAIVAELRATDSKVRAHEMAHVAAAGGYTRGGASFTYQTGPDGVQYAVGGEVQIDTAPISGDPEATLAKAATIRAAALAPSEPSSADRSVAAAASSMETDARAEIAQRKQSEPKGAYRAIFGLDSSMPSFFVNLLA